MILQGLHQPPFNATLMGVLIGALRYQGSQESDAWAFGASGHAFLMNIHNELCPSGPYCWNREGFFALTRNLGIATTDLGFYWAETPIAERQRVDGLLVTALDAGVPCALVNMEYQLITGYDATGFLTAQPWQGMDFPPAHLTFGTWAEMGDECHVNYFMLDRVARANERQAVLDSLAYAIDLYRNPERHSGGDYAVGAGAWANYIGAVRNGSGATHGNWWNGVVWSESRTMAALYLDEVGARFPHVQDIAGGLAADYRTLSEALAQASCKEMDGVAKVALLEGAATLEAACVERLEALVNALDRQ